jgi:hypothetical protein
MPKSNREPITAETGKQVAARPHDSGSAANETVDGLDATTEALRRKSDGGSWNININRTFDALVGVRHGDKPISCR